MLVLSKFQLHPYNYWHMHFSAYVCAITTDTCISVPIYVPSPVTHAFKCLYLCHHKGHMHFSAYICPSPVTHAFQCLYLFHHQWHMHFSAISVPSPVTLAFQWLNLCHHQWHTHFSAHICAITSNTCISVPISVPSPVSRAFQCHICAITIASVPMQHICDMAHKVTIYTIQYKVVLYLALFQNANYIMFTFISHSPHCYHYNQHLCIEFLLQICLWWFLHFSCFLVMFTFLLAVSIKLPLLQQATNINIFPPTSLQVFTPHCAVPNLSLCWNCCWWCIFWFPTQIFTLPVTRSTVWMYTLLQSVITTVDYVILLLRTTSNYAKFKISGHSIPTKKTHNETGQTPRCNYTILNYRNDTLLYRMHWESRTL